MRELRAGGSPVSSACACVFARCGTGQRAAALAYQGQAGQDAGQSAKRTRGLPVQPQGKVFAAKFKAALTQAGLSLPADLPERWVVDCKAVGDGQAALRYLGRYLYRGVIAERDILRCKDGMVTFRYRDAKSGKPATRTLSGADFLWLLLQNALPKGFQRARNFGFLHHNSHRALRLLQLLHLRPSAQSAASTSPPRPVWRCACGGVMLILRGRMRPEAVPACAAPQTAWG